MRDIIVKPGSWWRRFFPLVEKTRRWSWKYQDRASRRFVISGGLVDFMDARLTFPENVGLTYSTPLFWNGPAAYEGPTSAVLTLLISRSKLFLDVGSNIGIYAVYAGVKYPQVTTFAFEPVPVIFAKNQAFHQANQLSTDRVLNVAVGDREGVQELIFPIFEDGIEEEQTATLRADSWQSRQTTVERIPVSCTTLDAFAATHPLPEGMCCLKIDVENHEAAVLRGAPLFIQSRRPWIVCEMLPSQGFDSATGKTFNDNAEAVALIRDLNYVAFAVLDDGLFRMAPDDFMRPRKFKDFVLVPADKLPAEVFYLALSSLSELLPIS